MASDHWGAEHPVPVLRANPLSTRLLEKTDSQSCFPSVLQPDLQAMSHAAAAPHAHPGASEDDAVDFAREELRQFDNDDYEAGSNIGKMLSLFFLYTVFVMGFSAYVTYRWTLPPVADASAADHEDH